MYMTFLCYLLCVCMVFSPVPFSYFLPWRLPTQSATINKDKGHSFTALWGLLPDSLVSKQRIEGIVWRKEAVQNFCSLRTQYTGSRLHLVPGLQCRCSMTIIEKYSHKDGILHIIIKYFILVLSCCQQSRISQTYELCVVKAGVSWCLDFVCSF
jgi:hypothetical protein